MEKIISIYVFSAALFLLSTSFANATTILLQDPFDEALFSGNVEVTLVEGDNPNVKIHKNESQIKVDVEGGVLKVKRKKTLDLKDYKGEATIKITVTYQKLRTISAYAGAVITGKDILVGDQLQLDINSGAKGDFDVEVNALEAIASEGGVLFISGRTATLEAKAHTGGQLDATKLDSERTYVKALAGGNAKVNAQEALEAQARAGGVIEYKGNPKKVNIKDDLGGTVIEK